MMVDSFGDIPPLEIGAGAIVGAQFLWMHSPGCYCCLVSSGTSGYSLGVSGGIYVGAGQLGIFLQEPDLGFFLSNCL